MILPSDVTSLLLHSLKVISSFMMSNMSLSCIPLDSRIDLGSN